MSCNNEDEKDRSNSSDYDHCADDEFQKVNNKKRQHDFIQQGNKLRRLIRFTLLRALQFSSSSFSTDGEDEREDDTNNNLQQQSPQDRRIVWGNLVHVGATAASDVAVLEGHRYHHHAVALAQEKVQECAQLQRLLEDAKICSSSYEDQNKELVRKNDKLHDKLKRKTEALSIAGVNAAAARNDADSCHARELVRNSDRTLLLTLMEETKRACAQAKEEHEELHVVARQLESRTFQCESEKKMIQKQKRILKDEKDSLQGRVEEMEKSIKRFKVDAEESLEREENAVRLQKEQFELYITEKSQRVQLENEWIDYKKILTNFTRIVSEQEGLIKELNQVVEDLGTKNTTLHEQITNGSNTLEHMRKTKQEQITNLEIEKQKLSMKDVSNKEEIAKLKLDNIALEKQIQQLLNTPHPITTIPSSNAAVGHQPRVRTKDDTIDVEASSTAAYDSAHSFRKAVPEIDDKTSMLGATANSSSFFANNNSAIAPHEKNHHPKKELHENGNNIPPLRCFSSSLSDEKQHKQNTSVVVVVPDCRLCSKNSFGIMRMCQCGTFCGLRAHMSCLIGRSTIFCGDHAKEDK